MELLDKFKNNVFNPRTDDESSLPNKNGLYLICIGDINNLPDSMKNLEFCSIETFKVLYVGISRAQGIRKRDYKNHFRGLARNSTLRKSLGTLFYYEKYYYADGKYRFNQEHEKILSQWMKDNLVLFYYLSEDRLEEVECILIETLSPPLNIRENHSIINMDFRQKLTVLRNK
jgi:hypothetical protein